MKIDLSQPDEDSVERFRLKAIEWAEADGEARRLEKMEKIIFSEIVNQCEGSVAKAEHEARATATYKTHCLDMIASRTKANVLKAELEAMQMGFEAWRTRNATRRAEMKIL